MYPLRYSVIRTGGFDQIRIAGNPVYITVYPASNGAFYAEPSEKQYYGEQGNELYIFETTGYRPLMNPFQLQGLYAAIQWYGQSRLRQPNMKIRLTDPRRTGKDKPAN